MNHFILFICRQERKCPQCRTRMLFPLCKASTGIVITPALLDDALDNAKESARGLGGDHVGVLQALKGIVPHLPDWGLKQWYQTYERVSASKVRQLHLFPI